MNQPIRRITHLLVIAAVTALLLTVLLPTFRRSGSPVAANRPAALPWPFERLATVDIPGRTSEIVALSPCRRVLVSTNAGRRSLDVFDVVSLDPPGLSPMDLNGKAPGEGLNFDAEPTSVAVHPKQPVALVTVLAAEHGRPGRVLGVDLRPASLGRVLLEMEVGYHPDSIDISPDGRWALVACEAEGDTSLPGSIWAIDVGGLRAERISEDPPPPAWEVPGLAELVGLPAGAIEPEFVSFDPTGRLAAVSCQENEVVALVDCGMQIANRGLFPPFSGGAVVSSCRRAKGTGNADAGGGARPIRQALEALWNLQSALRDTKRSSPRFVGVVRLTAGAGPDGVALLDIPEACGGGAAGYLLAVAEEGQESAETGQALSLYRLAGANLSAAQRLARVDVRPLVDPTAPQARRDPEGVRLIRLGDRCIAAVTIERGDRLLCFDVSDPQNPRLVGDAPVGERPEGLLALLYGNDVLFITGDEGKKGPGTISFCRLRQP